MRKIVMFSAGLLIATSLIAQEDTTKAKNLDEVIVTGQYKPQSVKNSVYQVKTISKERIQKQGATKLQDVLNNELNIRFSQDPAVGGSGITMLGMSGQNVKILIDGMPVTGRQGTTNEININQIDINSIERIEIVEGPMSVVYGADALAGVINIITKKSGASKIAVSARAQEETVGKAYGIREGIHMQNINASFRHKRWDVSGGFTYNYFGGWKGDSTGRELAWHWKDQIMGNASVGYTTARFNIRYRFDGLDEIITNPGNFKTQDQFSGDSVAVDNEYLSRRVMQQLQAGYVVNKDLSFSGQAAYSAYRRQVYSTQLNQGTGKFSLNQAPGAQALVEFKTFTFRGTAQYRVSQLVTLQPGIDINIESAEGERMKAGNNKINDYAFFATAEFTPSDKINIRPGIRVIHNSVYDAPPVIPSINTKFTLAKNLDLRVAYARGFRSPSLRELYFNFIDANHTIVGNPNLKAETSHSFTGSLAWKKMTPSQVVYTTVLGGFYNDVKNLIGYAFTTDTAFVANVSNSKTAGVNLTTVVKYKNWNISVGGSYTGFYNDYSEADADLPQLQWSPEASATIGYTFSKIGLDANFYYKVTGTQPMYTLRGSDIVPAKLKGYQMADFTLNKKLFKWFNVNAGIRNLFDVKNVNNTVAVSGGTHTNSGSRSIAYGRSYFAGLAFNWNKN